MRFRWWRVMLLLCLALASVGASDSPTRQAKLQKQYEETLKSLKDNDEPGYQRLAQWCQANHLAKEAEHVRQLLLEKKRARLAKNPTLGGYRALAAWCAKQGLDDAAEEVRHDMLVFDYKRRKAKIEDDDVKGLQALAQWCQKNKLTAEATEIYHALLAQDPDNSVARSQLEAMRMAVWAAAPTGLLKRQKVPGYEQETAWYHISVPQEHKTSRSGLPLIIFLHGGQHNVGGADEIVALVQVAPALKNCIVLFPNHLKTWWAHPRELKYLLATVEQVLGRWHVDRKRIYLTGVSMGGNGAWAFGSQCPELFAAIAPMSGFWAEFLGFPMHNLKGKPIYILHGVKDTTVPIDGARQAYALLKKESDSATMCELDCGHQLPIPEISKAADWLLQHSNRREFDLKELKSRVEKMPVPQWLKQYEGN